MSVIILSGPVGAGKTTVAKQLVAVSPAPVACIEGDQFWTFIAKDGGIPQVKSFRTLMLSMVAASIPYAVAGFEVVIDFSIPPWFLDTVLKIVKTRNVPLHYIVIRPALAICVARAKNREEGVINDYALYRDLYTSFDGYKRYTISDDMSNAETLAKQIRAELNEGRFRVPE